MKKMVTRQIALTISLALALLGGLPLLSLSVSATATSSATSIVSVFPNTQIVSAGESFDVDVIISTDVASRGAQCGLDFDPDILDYTGFTEGSFYKDWASAHGGSTMLFPIPSENPAGHVTDVGIAVMGGDPGGPEGSGILVTLHFTALADGVSPLHLANVKVSDAEAGTIADVDTNDGQVMVGPTPTPTPTTTAPATTGRR